MEEKNGIVLALFGTSVEEGLPGLLNIRDKVRAQFPGTTLRMAFTSDIVRRIWQQRANDPEYIRMLPYIPDEIYSIQGPLATIANLHDAGHKSLVVQAVHIAPAVEYEDLCRCVAGLNSIKTIKSDNKQVVNLVVGRPVLGDFDSPYSCAEDIQLAASALKADIIMAREDDAALVYLGHGNKSVSACDLYGKFVAEMRRQYPDTITVMTTLEGEPSVEEAIAELNYANVQKVLLKPFLITSGGHVMKDMMGSHSASVLNRLKQAGFDVTPIAKGLGEQDAFAHIFVRHIEDAARDAGLELR